MSSLYAKLIDVDRTADHAAGAARSASKNMSPRSAMALSLPCPLCIVGSFLLVFIFPPSHPTPPGDSPAPGCNFRSIIAMR